MLDIIDKKRIGYELSPEELEYAFYGYMKGRIPDYQMSALLMAICLNGMTMEETVILTDLMVESGVKVDTSKIDGIMVDKHSTGGVGDKVTLIIGPILASLGLKFGKLSGMGLGITGGTIDKLESIPGFRVRLTKDEFVDNLNSIGISIAMQTPEFTPLDKMIYDLRNATSTVSSIPLIASSIMSKKIAIGARIILIDIKVGDGALIKNKEEAGMLARSLIEIGKKHELEVIPVLTDMSSPLGDNIGNALEVMEAIDILKGKTGHLRDLCVKLSTILYMATGVSETVAKKRVIDAIESGQALKKFYEFVSLQGGSIESIRVSNTLVEVKSEKSGTVSKIDARILGSISVNLGAGRTKKGDGIDYGVGIVIKCHEGDRVNIGDTLCTLYVKDDYSGCDAKSAFTII